MSFPLWKTFHFPTGGSDAADHADPDSDGMDNLLEYALQTLPATRTSLEVLPVITSQPAPGGGTEFQFTYARPLGVPGISYTWFEAKDVVRHPLVQRIVRAYEAHERAEGGGGGNSAP